MAELGGLDLTTSPAPREMTNAAAPVSAATRTTTERRHRTTVPTPSTTSSVMPR